MAHPPSGGCAGECGEGEKREEVGQRGYAREGGEGEGGRMGEGEGERMGEGEGERMGEDLLVHCLPRWPPSATILFA